MISESSKPTKVLFLEANDADVQLALRTLAQAGFQVEAEIARNSKEFIEQLGSQQYDFILAAYRLPDWNGLEALHWLRSAGHNMPFILVTGALGDDLAVQCITEGATDYVLKQQLDRLPRAFGRALEEERTRAHRDRAEQALRESEEHYRLLFNATPLPMWVFDLDTLAFLAVNEAAVRHYGFSPQEFLAMTVCDIRPPEDIPSFIQSLFDLPGGVRAPDGWRHCKKDRSVIDVEITSHDIVFHGRNARLVLAQDLTHQRRDQERLRRSDDMFAKAFRSSPLAITISSLAEGRYLDVNDAFLEMMGYAREEVIGRTANELRIWLAPEERSVMIEHLTEFGRVADFQTKFKTRSGEIRRTIIFAEPVELDGMSCVLAITQDVTQAQYLEEQLRQSQKMQAVGRLAGGVAHDFSNMLSVIIGYSELLQERSESAFMSKGIDEIRKAADRAACLTRQLLAFSRQQVLQPRVINLNDVVHSVSQMLHSVMPEDIELAFVCAASLGSAKADALQMEQVIMNLAVNARDAMPRGGKLMIETSNVDLEETYVSDSASFHPGPYVMLSVSDTGCGMDEQTMAHIFEPFFTTKAPGKGTGLGLAMVYGCVHQSGGHLGLHSEPGKGATFTIYLPRVDEPPTVEREKVTATPLKGSETILLVEDNEPLRKLTTSILERNGYTVLQASGGKQAIDVAKDTSGPIDLLITDVVMPGLNGGELAAILKAFRTDLKLLYISGYSNELVSDHGALASGAGLLEKPFATNSLLTKVRIVLDSE